NVTAHDKATGREQKITITASSGLSKQDVDRMVREAALHAQEDRQRKEEIELRNRADSIAYQSERTLKDVGDKISSGLRSDVEAKIQDVRDALSANDVNRIRTSVAALESTMQRVGQEIYSQAGAAAGSDGYSNPGAGTTGSEQDNDSGTIEGEYRAV